MEKELREALGKGSQLLRDAIGAFENNNAIDWGEFAEIANKLEALAATPAMPLAEELEELVAIDVPADGCLLKSNKYVKLADVRELLARKGITE